VMKKVAPSTQLEREDLIRGPSRDRRTTTSDLELSTNTVRQRKSLVGPALLEGEGIL